MSGLVVSAVLQVGLVVLIGLVFYRLRHKRIRGFWHWLGFRRTTWLAAGLAIAMLLALKLAAPAIEREGTLDEDPAAKKAFEASDNVNDNMLLKLGLSRTGLVIAALIKS